MVAVVIAACVADCAAERTQIANYAQNKMVGLTKGKSLLAWDRQLPKQQRVQLVVISDDIEFARLKRVANDRRSFFAAYIKAPAN